MIEQILLDGFFEIVGIDFFFESADYLESVAEQSVRKD